MDGSQDALELRALDKCASCSAALNGPDLAQSPTFGTPIRRCPVCRLLQCVGVTEAAIQHLNEHYREKWSAEQIASFQEGSFARANQQLKFIESQRGPLKNKWAAAIDIGAGVGGTCHTLQKTFRDVYAVEADPTSRAEIKKLTGIDAFASNREAFHAVYGQMDLVILSHVLEHIRDPVRFCNELSGFLMPGGYLLIEVPNEGQFTDDKHLSEATRAVNFGHLSLFDAESLIRMMAKVQSLDRQALTVTGPPIREWFSSCGVNTELASDQRGWIRAIYQKAPV